MNAEDSAKKFSFSWNTHFTCNYRCSYCWFHGKWQTLAAYNRYFSKEEVIRSWKTVFDKYGPAHIDILGGEPFLYPHFVEIIEEISKMHTLNITTNLSIDIKNFAQKISPERVVLNVSFHPLFTSVDTFLEKMEFLRSHGFDKGASYVAYPPHLRLWQHYKEKFAGHSFHLGMFPFWGKYDGKEYPMDYSEDERRLISPNLENRGGELFQATPKKIPKGALCRAGQVYAIIQPDGRAQKCGMDSFGGSLGNLFEGSFNFSPEPSVCTAERCPCNEWAFLLMEGSAPALVETPQVDTPSVSVASSQEGPRLPRNSPPHKVHWNWDITYRCNYKCSYCHFWRDKGNCATYEADIPRWKDIWDEIFDNYGCSHIRFSGGEPTIYPHFFDLVSTLAQKHTIDITTNFSFPLKQIVGQVSPLGLMVSPSFHPEFDDIGDFVQKVLSLRKDGFCISGIAYVAYPPHLKGLKEAMHIVESEKIDLKIIPFHGECQGRNFPEDYSEDERRLLRETVDSSHNRELNARWLEWNVKEERQCQEHKDEASSSHICRMGQMYAKIYPDGRVTRCCSPQSDFMGHIFEEGFRLLDEPRVCAVQNCPCFKAMFVGQEDLWTRHWGTPEHPKHKK